MLSTSTHVFSEIYLHFNWHCHNDRRMISPEIETYLHGHIRNYCHKCKGVRFHGIGGTEDHVHLVIQVEPWVAIAELVGKLKGSSSHEINRKFGAGTLQWQRGYGVVSF